jgi:hypothetical protein
MWRRNKPTPPVTEETLWPTPWPEYLLRLREREMEAAKAAKGEEEETCPDSKSA